MNSKGLLKLFFLLLAIPSCAWAQDIQVELEQGVNSSNLEFAPTFYKDGIVFLTDREVEGTKKEQDKEIDKNTFSIFQSVRKDDGELGNPIPFSLNLVSSVHEGPLTFNSTGDMVYFSRNNIEEGKKVPGEDGIVKMQILSASKSGSDWGNVKELPFNNDNYNVIHPTISVDNEILIYASDMPGGYGGYDLYQSKKVGNSWTFPQNMGPQVNSEGNDVFPFLHADGMLYFTSDKAGGNGGLDLYYTLKIDGQDWVEPVNMGSPFNTSYDDFSMIVDRDKKNGYFSSNREGGQGQDDIYRFFAASGIHSGDDNIVATTTIKIIDKESGLPIANTKLELFTLSDLSLNTDTPSDSDKRCFTNENGECVFRLPPNSYYTTIAAEGYSPTFEEFKVGQTNQEFIYALDKEQDCVELKGVIFNKENQYELSNVIIRIEETNNPKGELIEVTSDNEGLFENCLECNRLYAVRAVMNGQIIAEKTVSTQGVDCEKLKKSQKNKSAQAGGANGKGTENGEDGQKIELELEAENVVPPVEEGEIITLSNIYYNFDEARIRPDARVDLDKLIEFMKRYPSIEVELRSHTDSRGTKEYNYDLSLRRAENAVEYLTDQGGISRSRISPGGYGETQILNGCTDGVECTEAQHQYNRRTEVRITAINIPDVTIKYIDNKGNIISTTYSEYLKKKK
jgi:outer membrane protein OmpA-like peptidoglycan-associated protein